MKLYAIIISIIAIIIYIIFLCRHYIYAYLKYFREELKYRKDLSHSLKIDLKTRELSNSDVDAIIEFLESELQYLGYSYKGEFIIPDNIRRKLVYSKYSERSLKELFKLITAHMGITEQGVELEVKNISSKRYSTYAGLYDEGSENTGKKICIVIKPDFSYETVVSILIHESTHYFLLTNGINLEEIDLNEYLTDVATIYFGFGKYMLQGYKENKKLVYVNETERTTSYYKVGYLEYSDVKYIMKKLKKKYKK